MLFNVLSSQQTFLVSFPYEERSRRPFHLTRNIFCVFCVSRFRLLSSSSTKLTKITIFGIKNSHFSSTSSISLNFFFYHELDVASIMKVNNFLIILYYINDEMRNIIRFYNYPLLKLFFLLIFQSISSQNIQMASTCPYISILVQLQLKNASSMFLFSLSLFN